MYEPKYKLNKKDAERWHSLLVRHCLEAPVGGVVNDPKYPALTPKENIEFERLSRKRSRKHEAHPKVKESIRVSKLANRRVEYKLKKLMQLVEKFAHKLPSKEVAALRKICY